MSTRIKIRGIYSTALTKLFIDSGYAIVDPSDQILERFDFEPVPEPYDLLILDREGHQGIELTGDPEVICGTIKTLQAKLFDAVLLDTCTEETQDGFLRAEIEFPGMSKRVLDELRRSVIHTVEKHHRYRIIDSKALKRLERSLDEHPEEEGSLEDRLFQEEILAPLRKSRVVRVEHIRSSGKPMRPREGMLVSVNGKTMVLRRSFSQGRYDGLDIPIEPGDYGLTEVREGSWYIKHAYYNKKGRIIGEYYNINTPVELYPYGARYVDLEVDVIRRAGEGPSIIDREKLEILGRHGCIGSSLESKAMEVAEEIMQSLEASVAADVSVS
jgi:hypothetical protein